MQEVFDAAFMHSAKEAGMDVEPAPSGQRFWDVALNGQKISLKTTKAKSLKRDLLHISKLTEAAWIQDCRTAKDRMERTFELFRTYTEEVDSIFQFRFFTKKSFYELIEIQVDMLEAVMDVPKSCFAADGPSISIPVGSENPDFTLKLDRSDAKITLANIRKSKCVMHASWKFE